MPLGKVSLQRLSTCEHELISWVKEVAAGVDRGECKGVKDITVLCGHRGQAAQNQAFKDGTSKKMWPDSEHNYFPSKAVDIAPYPVDWTKKGLPAFKALRTYALSVADRMGLRLRVISWDWPHYEKAKPAKGTSPSS